MKKYSIKFHYNSQVQTFEGIDLPSTATTDATLSVISLDDENTAKDFARSVSKLFKTDERNISVDLINNITRRTLITYYNHI